MSPVVRRNGLAQKPVMVQLHCYIELRAMQKTINRIKCISSQVKEEMNYDVFSVSIFL